MNLISRSLRFIGNQVNNNKLDKEGIIYLANQYAIHAKTSTIPAIIFVISLVFFDINSSSQHLVIPWALLIIIAQILRYIYAVKSLNNNDIDKFKYQFHTVEVLSTISWCVYPFLMSTTESSEADYVWRGFLIYILYVYYLDVLRHCKLALLVHSSLACFFLIIYLHFYTVLEPRISGIMTILLIGGWCSLLFFGWIGYRLVCSSYNLLAENRLLIAKLDDLVAKDELTKIYNRRYFVKELTSYVALYYRYQQPFSLAVIDIDHFKKINDSYGHNIGDKVLISLTQLISENLRSTDLFARYGGEEFVLVLRDSSLETIKTVLEKLRHIIANNDFVLEQLTLKLSVSMGGAMMSADDDVNSIFKRADLALYKAKENGRNRIEFALEQ